MNAIKTMGTFLVACFLFTCSNEPLAIDEIEAISARYGTQFKYNCSLLGSNEVPANDSDARGHANITISRDESMISYKITASKIDNIAAAHFHYAPPGLNGEVVATLYSNPNQPSGPNHGVLVNGVITSSDVTGVFDGDISALIGAIRSGVIYINVHTLDYPAGEIRGQVE